MQLPHSHHEGGFCGSVHRRVTSDSLRMREATGDGRAKAQRMPEVRHEDIGKTNARIR